MVQRLKGWSPIVAVVAGVLVCVAGAALIDWIVLQLYPLPPGLSERASMREIIGTRPDAAVALNLGGGLIVLTAAAFIASRQSRARTARAGLIVTGIVMLLVVVNSLATANFRWLHAVALPLSVVSGVVAAKRGAARQM